MKKRLISVILALAMALSTVPTALASDTAVSEPDHNSEANNDDLRLWYDEPAESWMMEALPIGNGYLGGMIYGGVEKEVIQFNEKTLWSGGPGSSGYNFGIVNEEAYKNLEDIRAQLEDGQWGSASLLNPMYGSSKGFGYYQNFGEIHLDFGSDLSGATSYERYLDLSTATAGVMFEKDGVQYTREYFANYPDNVMVMRLSASEAGALSFNVSMTSAQNGDVTAESDEKSGQLVMRGALEDNGMQYEAMLRVLPEGGRVSADGGTVMVQDADAVVLMMTAGTDYKNEYPTYRGEDPHAAIVERMANAEKLGYEKLRQRHLEDYQEIFSRVELDLDQETANVPTDELLKAYYDGTYDPQQLEVLLFQYGRYLMISSSREGSLPANLQGVWNNSNTPEWNGDYHFNINVQMNYWPAYVTNMEETAIPLVDYVDSLREPGRRSAEVFMGIESTEENPENGWMVTTMNNPFGNTAIGWGSWGWSPAANAWISQNLWEYYEFTGDEEYLRNEIYPIIREAAVFWTQALVYDEHSDRLVSSPSYSPEQGPLTAGCTFDQELIWQLYTDVIQASEVLGVDEELRNTLIEQRDQLDPLYVSEDGTLKEWYDEDVEGFPATDPKHRHVSHLVGLYPGKHLTSDMTEYFEAAKKTLEERGDGGTGWSRAHKLNLWARLLDGDHAYQVLASQLERSTTAHTTYDGSGGGTYDNLFCAHPPFQIDGNAGATAGMAEMLLQSHTGEIVPLAALPSQWENGSYKGLVARGNFETDATWQGGNLTSFTVRSNNGGECVIAYPGIAGAVVTCNGETVSVSASDADTIAFDTVAGSEYQITSIPATQLSSPQNLTAVRTDVSLVELHWDNVDGAESYNVYRSVNGGDFECVAYAVPTNGYTDKTAIQLTSEYSYSYRVAAVDAQGNEGNYGQSVHAVWADGSLTPVESIELSSTTGLATLRMIGEQIQLSAAIQPADATEKSLTWSATGSNGKQSALVTVDENGLITATGNGGSDTVTITAAAKDGSGVTGSFTLQVNTPTGANNLLAGLTMELTEGNNYSGYGPKFLTDGYTGGPDSDGKPTQRLALTGGSIARLEVELDALQDIDAVDLYERIDTLEGFQTRISSIEVLAKANAQDEWSTVGTIVNHKTVNYAVEHWHLENISAKSVKYLQFVLHAAGGSGENAEMSVWEIEAYSGEALDNAFAGQTFDLSLGSTYGGYGPNFLTDGYTGGPDSDGRAGQRLALTGVEEAWLDMNLAEETQLSTIALYERIDLAEGNASRIDSIEVMVSENGSDWTAVAADSVTHQTLSNDVELWTVSGIQMENPTQWLRLVLKDAQKSEMTVWEIEGYAMSSDSGRITLLKALEEAALCLESDFGDEAAWNAFQSARETAIAVANEPDSTDEAMREAAETLQNAMNGVDVTPVLDRIEITASSDTLPVGMEMQVQVTAYYDRGLPVKVDSSATYTSVTPEIASVSENGKITALAAGTAIIQASFEGKQAQMELEVLQDPNGQLTVVCGNGGTIVRSAEAPYVPDQQVTLEAKPDLGYQFTNWLVDGEEITENPLTVTVGQTTKVVACFQSVDGGSTVTRYTITVKQSEGGKISPATCRVDRGSDKTFTVKANDGYEISDVLVDGKSVGAVSTYTFENVKSSHTITAKFEKTGESGGVSGFADVKESDWFAEAVQYVVDNKLMGGVSETKFAPNSATTRAMFVTILARMEGVDTTTGSTWYEAGQKWAMEEGISDGSNMEGTMTREQLATMLYRYAGSPAVSGELTGFGDAASVSGWASDAMQWAVAEGILNGSDGKLNPQGSATRAQVAAMLMRFVEKTA